MPPRSVDSPSLVHDINLQSRFQDAEIVISENIISFSDPRRWHTALDWAIPLAFSGKPA